MTQLRFVEAVRQALADEMEADPSVVLMGEEVGRLGGVFTVTKDLIDRFGEDRVMVETDYPHGDTVWPSQQAMLRYEVGDLDHRAVRKVCYDNAAQLYRWTPPPAELLDASTVGRP